MIATVVVTWNGRDDVVRCLDSLLEPSPAAPPIVVDNGSTDGTLDLIDARGCIVIRNPDNRGFTVAANQGLRAALELVPVPLGVLLLNQDAWLENGAVGELETALEEHDDVGVVGCRLIYPGEDRIQHAGGKLERPRMTGSHLGHGSPMGHRDFGVARDVDFVTGAALCARTTALQSVGLLDELFSPGYYEDVDLCVRMNMAGWRILYWPQALVRHFESSSFDNRHVRLSLGHRNRLLFVCRYVNQPGYLAEFRQAERDFITGTESADDLRALISAVNETLLRLDSAVHSSPSLTGVKPGPLLDYIDVLAHLRHVAIDRLIARLHS
jgi:GT2 family glycosyltransferase